jgi:hypothetical protein
VAACAKAAELIPDRLKDPDRFVRVGDYLVSEFEVSQLLPVLEEQFQQRMGYGRCDIQVLDENWNVVETISNEDVKPVV